MLGAESAKYSAVEYEKLLFLFTILYQSGEEVADTYDAVYNKRMLKYIYS